MHPFGIGVVMISLPFANRQEAGRLLAEELAHSGIPANAVTLALPRGGVPVGFAVAEQLRLPLDVIVVRKIGVPWQPELAMGAIAGSSRFLDQSLISELRIPDSDVEEIIEREHLEMTRREQLYRSGRKALDLRALPALLVDDGLATGSTMLVAIKHVRTLKPSEVIVAVPVASEGALQRIRSDADRIVCLATPRHFSAVGQWFRDFGQVNDAEVRTLLSRSHYGFGQPPTIPAAS
jgi:putative phosphoribosyl transferase